MLSVFEGDSVEDIWSTARRSFCELKMVAGAERVAQPSRVGQTLELLHSVIHLTNPRQRWAYSRRPALNPAFALAEVIWILAGRQDAAFPNHWNPALPKFAGSGATYYGAYGHRLRHAHGVDQLQRAYEALQSQPDNRQVVLQIWLPQTDMPDSEGKSMAADIPCNISSLLKVRNGRLEWTQIMRSNDLYRGFPYNVVQWTSIQEVLAGWLGIEVGSYVHLSDSLHVYEEHWDDLDTAGTGGGSGGTFPINTDSLALPKPEFNKVFPEVERRAERITHPDLPQNDLSDLANLDSAPIAYQNLLRVLAADSARRRGWKPLAAELMAGCKSPALSLLWDQWLRRKAVEHQ
jgi:thymidylate synthase